MDLPFWQKVLNLTGFCAFYGILAAVPQSKTQPFAPPTPPNVQLSGSA